MFSYFSFSKYKTEQIRKHNRQLLFFEKYIIYLKKVYFPLISFRTSSNRLPVETGRWENLPLNER